MEKTAPHSLFASRSAARTGPHRSPDQWARETYAFARLPDRRLKKRLVEIAGALAGAPGDSFSQACANWAQTKGAYRFVENKRLEPESLARPLAESTARRCAGEEAILAVQDTTFLSFPAACHAEGLGKINDSPSRGIALHSTIALRANGMPLGIAHLHSWCRKEDGKRARDRANLPIEEKESVRWRDAMRAVHETFQENLAECDRPRIWHIADREGDIHELFVEARALGDAIVVRSARNRCVEAPGEIAKAHESVARSPLRGAIDVPVPRKPGKKARKARVEIRFQPQTLAPPRKRRGKVALWLIEAREPNPPAGEKPLCWRLWTNEKVNSFEHALAVVEIYRKRWVIEEYHRVLKEGCRIESVRFHTAKRIRLVTALYAPVALRIVEMRDLARLHPDESCVVFLSEPEWRVLWTLRKKRPPKATDKPPTIAQAVKWIGALGGHLGRKSDGMPGVKTLWRGFRDLQLLAQYEEARKALAPEKPT